MTTSFSFHQAMHSFPDQADFWRAWIAGRPSPTSVPRDRLGQDPAAPLGVHHSAVPADAEARFRAITRDDPALVRIALTAVLALVAARATDSDEVAVVSAGGPQGAPAFPLSVGIDRLATFRSLLTATREAYLTGARHLDVPVGFLFAQEGAAPGDFALTVDDAEAAWTTPGEVQGADATPDEPFAAPLRFHVTRHGTPRLEVHYRADLFTAATALRMAETFTRVLAEATADPDASVGPLLDADDRERQGYAALNATAADFPAEATLHSFLERQAVLTPDRVAITDDGTTYGELNRRANRFAHALRAHGVGPGDLIGICLPRSPLTLVTLYAVLKAGAAYLPLDPTLPAARIDHLIEHSGARMVLGTADTRQVAARAAAFLDVTDEANLDDRDHNPDGGVGADDLCYVIYTSGSTGLPKGVMVEHRAIVNRLWWMQRAYPLRPDDVVLHKTPFTFDVSVWELFWWSLAGASVTTLPSGHERDPERITAQIADAQVTVAHFVPSMLQAFLRYAEAVGASGQLAPLRQVFSSGEALPTATVRSFTAFLGDRVGLINLYGPTEAAVDVSHFDCAGLDPRRLPPIGRPIDNIRLYVLTRAGTEAPVGAPGELHIAGTGLARGYLGAEELTKERFVPDTVTGSGRMYRTGDLVRWLDSGDIEYLGRLDAQVKIRGHRIEPGEIEHVAARCPGVADCAVVAVTDESADRSLCAYVVPGPGFDEGALRDALAAELPSYMAPRHVMTVDAIPISHNGKRDTSQMPRPETRPADREAHVAPRDATERRFAEVWARALGVARLEAHDDFFALGGDSIKGVVVLAALREAGFDLSFQELFAHPTVAEAAALARPMTPRPDSAGPVPATPVAPFRLLSEEDRELMPPTAQDAYPLSALQAGLLYEVARTGEAGLYHDVASYRVRNGLDLDAFREALGLVAERHPILRTSFHATGFSTPLQVVHRSVPLPLTVVDLSGAPEPEQDAALDRFAHEEPARAFALGEPGLVRVVLHLLGGRGYQYSLSYHAAALDGWSVSTLHRDLFQAYFSVRNGHGPRLPHVGARYPDFLELEREAVASGPQRDFWASLLDGAQSTRIPRLTGEDTGMADARASDDGLLVHDVPLPEGMSAAVLRTAARLRVPVKSVLLTAHVAVMGFVAGTDDVLVGYEHSGRPEVVGGERLAGLFLNTVPFRLRLEDVSWAELVRSVHAAEARMLPHRRYPMGEIKRRLGVRGALFESVFNFTHFHVLKELARDHGFELVRSRISSRTEFPFRAEFWQDAFSDEVGLALHCHAGEFTAEQAGRIAGYYVKALAALTAHPDEQHAARTLLGDDELALLTERFAGPREEIPPGTLLDAFARQVSRRPGGTAVSHGTRHLDYRALDSESDRVAAFLRGAGVGRGDVVAVPMDRGLPWAVSVLAILKAGAVYLPQEPSDPPERVAAMLRRSGCRHALLAAPHTGELAPALVAAVHRADGAPLTVLDYEDARRSPTPTEPLHRPGPDDAAYMIFTSGSTGEPKGAVIHHRGMLNHLLAKYRDLGLDDTDQVAQVATQCFDISVWQLVAAWLVGGRTVIFDHELVADFPAFLTTVRRERISVLELVPSYLDALLSETGRERPELPGLRYTLVTGETLPPALTRRWFARYDVPLVNAYGPTEASDDVTHHVVTGPVEGDRVPVGRPVLNTRLYVVGPDGRILPVGSYGEIVVTGPGVGLGYVNDPERTAAAFRENTYDDSSALLYRTGDVGRWLPSGELDCAGRVDHQVKVRGHRIELTEIEGALTRVPGIDHAVVLVRTVVGKKTLAAFYTGAAEPDLSRIREAAGATLPAYMLPDSLVRLDALPLTRNGKVDRAALGRLETGHDTERRREGPADALEAEVLRVYTDVLGTAPDALGVTDNFFNHGGHSLAAMRVAARLGGRAALRDVVARPTARGLAAGIRAATPGDRPLLTDLTEAAGRRVERAEVTIVCFPFAGGGAVSYVPLARALADGGRPVRVLGVDLPGRDRDDVRLPVPAAQLVEELAYAVAEETRGDLVVLGHSAGCGPALATGLALRRMGHNLAQFVAVAAVLPSLDPKEYRTEATARMTDTEVFTWLAENTGLREAAELPVTERADVARAFRYDLVTAGHSLSLVQRDPGASPLGCPVTVLLADDDPLTRDRHAEARHWGRFGTALRLATTDGGSHYLNATRPAFLADEIRASLSGGRK
ncbi:non-ribosomal peptide synthetase [Streptomyces demainii]|uniref:Amino acid adenylation domain-containing protein n=1 Tax=Streptomyces demainii TaxID=588122 RepID=A0ABT9L6X2_9ACTN|nr:non-ribosomal peptide synthetase [Streptomyces demainii]MDP9616454.1 amino acid adenylation domain-containing protein [Streptomyces demainii]